MTSGQHLAPLSREVASAVSKGALHQATKTLSNELIDRSSTVNTVNPGPTDTGWEITNLDPRSAMPLGRWGHPEDAARLIAWLCRDEAAWITGQSSTPRAGSAGSGPMTAQVSSKCLAAEGVYARSSDA